MTNGAGRKRDVTVADVARKAGVGKATASRVLGDYGHFSDANRTKVLAAAEALGYRPNELARSMNTGRTKTVGLIIGDIENTYFSRATRGVSDAVREAGYDLILINTSERLSDEVDAVRVLLDKRVDAIIVSPASAYHVEHLREAIAADRPVVLLDREVDDVEAPAVRVDVASAAEEATRLLLDAGHRRIGFLSALGTDGPAFTEFPLGISSVEDRLAGIMRALEASGLPIDHELFRFGALGLDATRGVLSDLLDRPSPPTALVVSDSTIMLDLLAVLRERGLEVPHDLSIVSFDDPAWTAFTTPPLTVVAQPTYEVGREAALTALKLIGADAPRPAGGLLPATITLRDSVSKPRARRER